MKFSSLARNLIIAVLAYVCFGLFLAAVVVGLHIASPGRTDFAILSLVLFVGPFLLLAAAAGWAAYRISRSAEGLSHMLAFFSVLHSATVLVTWFMSNHYAFTLSFETWVVAGLSWLAWPIALLVLPRRSFKSFAFSTATSLVLLAPCMSRLLTLTPSSLGLAMWRWPRIGESVLERAENLGYGFSDLTIAEMTEVHLFHLGYLYYRGRRLGQHGPPPSISPSGRFAVYQEASGNLILFRRADQKSTQLTSKFVGAAYPFVWHEDQGTVEVQFAKGVPPMTFPLQ